MLGWVDQEGCRVIQYPRGRRGFVPPLLSAMAGLMAHFGFFPQILSADSSDASCLGDSSGVHCAHGALIGQDRLIGVGIDLEGVGTRFADRWCWRTHSIDWKLYCPVLRFLVSGSILLSFLLFFLLFHSIPLIFFSISFPYFF